MPSLYTYDDASRREDVSDIVDMLDVTDTQLMTGFQKVKAENTLHEYLKDSLDTAGDNAQVEGVDFTAGTITAPSRLNNITQIFGKYPQVTRTEMRVKKWGMEDAMAYQKTKAMRALKNDIEFALMRGTQSSGTGSAARRLKGVLAQITTNATAYASATTLDETRFNDLVTLADAQGGQIDEVYTTMALKRQISKFTGGNIRYLDIKDRRLVSSVDVYEADASPKPIKIFRHRHIFGSVSGDATAGIIGLDSSKWAIAELDSPFFEELSKSGDSMRGQVIAELTLEARNEKANFKATGLHNAVL